ncbi:MAG: peptidase MA family metallohydrolase [Anaerolineae bacterium]
MRSRFVLVILSLVLFAMVSSLVLAQGDITVTTNTYEYSFPKEIVFHLMAESNSEINTITLMYRVGDEPVTNRAYPEFSPAKQVKAEYIWRLQRGEIPPGSDVEYYWQIEDAAGNALETEPIAFTYMDDRFTWQSLNEGKIILYWYDADQAFGRELLSSAVESLARLEENVGVELGKPVKIIVYQSKADMQEALISQGAIFEEQIITLGTVVAPDTVLLHGTHQDVDRTIAHELTHVVVGLATENPYVEIPAWLNEGLAMYNEGELRSGNAQALAEGIRENRLISVRSLTSVTGNPAEVNLFYGEAYSVVDFLLKTYGREKMSELLKVFKEGALADDALMEIYGLDQDELDAQWRESIGVPPRGEAGGEITPEAPEAKKPAGGPCWGALPALALAVLSFLLKLRLGFH